MSFDTWMQQLSCCRMKSFPISLLILGRAFSSSKCLKLSLFCRPFSHSNHIFPLAKIIPQTITPPPPICRLFSTTGSPLLDQVHHPLGPLNLKRFSSVNITFLKSTCFINHILAHSSLASLCFFVSVIFFLAFAYFKPILCSVLCTVRTFTSNSHFSITFLAVTFSPDVKSHVTVLFILLSVLLPIDLFRPLFFFRSEFVFSMYSTVDFDSFKFMAILLMLRPSSRFFCAKQTTSFECIYLIILNCFAKKCPDYLCC